MQLEVLDDRGKWVEIELPVGIRAVIFCNLQSYGGGRDLWKHGPQVHILRLPARCCSGGRGTCLLVMRKRRACVSHLQAS